MYSIPERAPRALIALAVIGLALYHLVACSSPGETTGRSAAGETASLLPAADPIAEREIARRQVLATDCEIRAGEALRHLERGEMEEGVRLLDEAYGSFPKAPLLADRRKKLAAVREQKLHDYAKYLASRGRRDEARAILLRLVGE